MVILCNFIINPISQLRWARTAFSLQGDVIQRDESSRKIHFFFSDMKKRRCASHLLKSGTEGFLLQLTPIVFFVFTLFLTFFSYFGHIVLNHNTRLYRPLFINTKSLDSSDV